MNKTTDFYLFLAKRNALAKFKKNWKRVKGGILISSYLKDDTRHRVLSSAFSWGDTQEGFRFWADINREWEIKIKNGKTKN